MGLLYDELILGLVNGVPYTLKACRDRSKEITFSLETHLNLPIYSRLNSWSAKVKYSIAKMNLWLRLCMLSIMRDLLIVTSLLFLFSKDLMFL